MRIGIDCRTILNPALGEAAGVGHYTYFLVKHLLDRDPVNTYVLFFDSRMADVREFECPNANVRKFAFSQYKKFLPFTYSHMLITAMLLKEKLDIFHAPANIIPLTYPKRAVVTVHDLAIYKNPAWFPSQIFSTKLLVPQSLKRAQHIIAVSESTKSDLREIFGVPSRKVSVIYEAPFTTPVDVRDKNVNVLTKFRLDRPYLLFVGTIDARKNLETLLEAFAQLRKEPAGEHLQLVIAGGKGHKHEAFFDRVQQLKLGDACRYLGYVTHNEKLGLYRKAAIFVFPSLYEGFGLPVLEAMRLGVPVVAANSSSVPEIAGNAALLVPPENAKALARAIRSVLGDPQQAATMVQRGFAQANRFDWTRAAAQTLAVYEKVGKKGRT